MPWDRCRSVVRFCGLFPACLEPSASVHWRYWPRHWCWGRSESATNLACGLFAGDGHGDHRGGTGFVPSGLAFGSLGWRTRNQRHRQRSGARLHGHLLFGGSIQFVGRHRVYCSSGFWRYPIPGCDLGRMWCGESGTVGGLHLWTSGRTRVGNWALESARRPPLLCQAVLSMYCNQRPGQLVSLRPVERLLWDPFAFCAAREHSSVWRANYLPHGVCDLRRVCGHLGDEAMTANQACLAESLGFIGASGFGIAAGALVAQKLGAGQPQEAQTVGWISMGLGSGLLTLFGVLFVVIPETLVGLIISDPEAIALGATCLRITAISQPLMAIHDTMAGLFEGLDTRSPMLVTLVGCGVMRLGACYVLAWPMGLGLIGNLDWNHARLVAQSHLGHSHLLARPLEDPKRMTGLYFIVVNPTAFGTALSASYYDFAVRCLYSFGFHRCLRFAPSHGFFQSSVSAVVLILFLVFSIMVSPTVETINGPWQLISR